MRVIPVLLVRGGDLVKTTRFRKPVYIGDPINAVRIFNEKGVDELVVLDIGSAGSGRPMLIHQLQEIVSEAFMPIAYGGGVACLGDVEALLKAGVEKVIINSASTDTSFIVAASARFGSQAMVASIDVSRSLLGRQRVVMSGGRMRTRIDPVGHAQALAAAGVGEIIVTSVDREGTMAGYDIALVRSIADAVAVPVVANGGAGSTADFVAAVRDGHASAVAAGSMFVFQGRHRAVLINFPEESTLQQQLFSKVAQW